MSTVAGKPEFLAAWKQARNEALTKKNILRGWETTGIFPRDPSKPLNSRLAKRADAVTPGEQRSKTPDQGDAPLPENDLQRPQKQRRVLPRAQHAFIDIEDISQARAQLRDEADRVRPRRSTRQQLNWRSETPEIEDSPDQEIEEVLEEIQVMF